MNQKIVNLAKKLNYEMLEDENQIQLISNDFFNNNKIFFNKINGEYYISNKWITKSEHKLICMILEELK